MALCIHSHNTAALSDAWAQHALGSSYNQPIKVIQLEEVEAPPPMPHRSNTSDTSVPYSDSDDSEDDYDEDEDMSESEEEESECSSYCSSDAEDMQERNIAVFDDTYGTRLSRVLAWRDNYAKAIGLLPDDKLLSHTPHPMKRKIDYEDVFDDSTSSSSKRSRSTSPEPSSSGSSSSSSSTSSFSPVPSPWAQRRLSAHSCPACDEGFTTKQSLQQHGLDPKLNDACRVAVLYNLEA